MTNCFLQEEILEIVGDEGLKLGLLIRTQSSSTQEVETELFCFHYLLLQEFVAGKYVATLPKVFHNLYVFQLYFRST